VKRSRIKTTKWNLFFHYYAIAFSIAWGVLLVPLYLKYIPLEIYGAWLATGNIVAWITVVDPGISDVLRQQVGKVYGAGEIYKLNDYLGSGTLLSLIISLIILIVGLISSNFIIGLINISDLNSVSIIKNAFILAVIGSTLLIFSFGFTSFSQGLLGSIGIGLVFVIATLISLVINVILLIKGYGLYSIPISQIIRALILIVGNVGYIFWRYMQEHLKFNFSIKGFSVLVKLSSHNVLGRLGNVISTQIDSLLVARFLGPEIAPILNLTKKGPELSRMFVERPPIAMLPAITNAWGSGEYEKVRENIVRLFIIMLWLLGLVFTSFIVLNKSFVTLWVGQNLYAGNLINVIICLGIILSVGVSITSNIFFALGNIKETSKINFLQSVITVVALYLGIKYLGLIGLVTAQLLSMLIYSAWYFPYRTFKFIKFDLSILKLIQKEIAIIVITSLLIILILKNIVFATNWISFFILGLILVSAYISFLLLFSKAFRKEVRAVLQYVKIKKQ
jgi:O-antigen/teichoic acid export membrane protein